MSEFEFISGYRVYPFKNRKEFLFFLENGNWENILVALNAEKLIKKDKGLRRLVNENIGYPDGVGAVWALRKKGAEAVKIPGSEFWLDIIEAFFREKSFYLVGSKPEVIEQTVVQLKKQFPGIEIKGYQDGYFNEEQYKALRDNIIQSRPDVVFVAMGSPRQEYIMQDIQQYHNALYMGLGGSFDVYTGHVERAPETWINLNLEWAYRLVKQPKRVFRQRALITFMYRYMMGKL